MKALTNAACVAVGSELLGDQKLDTNSLAIARALAGCGVSVLEKRVVGDDSARIAAALRDLLGRVDLVVVTGGLGPTADDVTRSGVARALGVRLTHDPEVEGRVRARYESLERAMPAIASEMAKVVPGSKVLDNTRGAAPGLLIEAGDRLLAVFPGVPWEMEEMLERDLVPELVRRNHGRRVLTRLLLLGGVVESDIESRIRPLYERFGRADITILSSHGLVRLVLSARGEGAADRLAAMEAAFVELAGDDLAGIDVGSIAEAVLTDLRGRGLTLATAESCTGGMVGEMLTDVAGSSSVFRGGVVAYSNEVKHALLGVPEALLIAHGAVSEQVARAMAQGVRKRLGTDWGLGITGVAGPDGGTEEKPVGLVHWAVAGPDVVEHGRAIFPGTRDAVRRWSAHSTLDLLRRAVARAGTS